MSDHEYFLAWIYYSVAALLFFIIACHLMRNWWVEVKQLARPLLAALLFTPWYSDLQHGLLAPAWLSCVADLLLEREGGFWRAGLPLLVSLCVVTAFSTLWAWLRWFQRK